MCFGGGGSAPAQAPVETPAVPVDQITAGQPTVTVAPNNSAAAAASQQSSQNNSNTPSPTQQSSGSGLQI